jgi:hypothetical protein
MKRNQSQTKRSSRSIPKCFGSEWGRSISKYRKDQIVYTQGEPTILLIFRAVGQEDRRSEQGEAVVGLFGTGIFGEGDDRSTAASGTVRAMADWYRTITKADVTRGSTKNRRLPSFYRALRLATGVEEDLVINCSIERKAAGTDASALANFGK